MLKRTSFLITLFLTLLGIARIGCAQELYQTIRGVVIDRETEVPLIGANIVVVNSDPFLGASSDLDGKFSIAKVPVGRHHLKITFLGYEETLIPNVLVGSGKEVVLRIKLAESIVKMKEVEITADQERGRTVNDLAFISARAFTVEETKRYAGSFDDPGRMALTYAGVGGGYDGTNELVIRGNSPRGVLWRVEGIEIPNPNHFSEQGASGGAISMLSSNMMTNSDFFTGAFPAEYGNAASGVFDIRLRKGNNEQREYAFQAGVLGCDFALEGPFSGNSDASYLINYRYSSLAALEAMGIAIVGDAVPVFQDLSWNIHLPTKKMGNFSFFGIGGKSAIEESGEGLINNYQDEFSTDLGIAGLSHNYLINNRTLLKTTVGVTGTLNRYYAETLDTNDVFLHVSDDERFTNTTFRASSVLNRKINAQHNLKTGLIYSHLMADFRSEYFDTELSQYINDFDGEGDAGLAQTFVNWKYRISEPFTLNTGIHYLHFFLNDNYSIEPRAALQWQFAPTQTLSAGFGIHSRVEDLTTYFAQSTAANGSLYRPNADLELSKARHFVIGYGNQLYEDFHVKLEIYFQELYDVPVAKNDSNAFSTINFSDGYTTLELINSGTGTNTGVEITLEKFFSKNYYFLATGSFFDSKYKGSDGIERNTVFNGNYIVNFLAGKEFPVEKNGKQNTFGISGKLLTAGGRRQTPILLAASIEEGTTVRDESRILEQRLDGYFRLDLQFTYRRNRPKTTHFWKLDIQNATNRLNVFQQYFDPGSNAIEVDTHIGIIPVLSYKIQF